MKKAVISLWRLWISPTDAPFQGFITAFLLPKCLFCLLTFNPLYRFTVKPPQTGGYQRRADRHVTLQSVTLILTYTHTHIYSLNTQELHVSQGPLRPPVQLQWLRLEKEPRLRLRLALIASSLYQFLSLNVIFLGEFACLSNNKAVIRPRRSSNSHKEREISYRNDSQLYRTIWGESKFIHSLYIVRKTPQSGIRN